MARASIFSSPEPKLRPRLWWLKTVQSDHFFYKIFTIIDITYTYLYFPHNNHKAISMSDIQRQLRITRPTAKLINNGEKAALTFQRAAVAAETARLQVEAALKIPTAASKSSTSSSSLAFTQQSSGTNDLEETDDQATPSNLKHQIISDDESSVESGTEQKERQKKKLKRNGM